MGPRPPSLHVLVLHNDDYLQLDPADPHYESRADVANVARQVAGALSARGHAAEIASVDVARIPSLLARLDPVRDDRPDLVFNLCESLDCDNRHEIVLPSLFDLAGVPYTGSGPFALGLAMRKDRTKDVLRARGVPTPASLCVESEESLPDCLARLELPFPLIVKPTREDASVGIHAGSVVRDRAALERAVRAVLVELRQPALVERFIDGREMYVSLLGNAPPRALPFHEIDFTGLPDELPRIVSYAGKWDTDSAEFIYTRPTRCRIEEPLRAAVERAARDAFDALGLADYARIDVRLAPDGTPYVIDVNPNCDLGESAGFARAAGYGGLDYPSLVEEVCLAALARHEARPAAQAAPPVDGVVPLDPARGRRVRPAARADRRSVR